MSISEPTTYLKMPYVDSQELRSMSSRRTASRSNEADLQSLSPQEAVAEIEMRSLPPSDHGKHAYLVLAGCTLIQAPVWGTNLLHDTSASELTNI